MNKRNSLITLALGILCCSFSGYWWLSTPKSDLVNQSIPLAIFILFSVMFLAFGIYLTAIYVQEHRGVYKQ